MSSKPGSREPISNEVYSRDGKVNFDAVQKMLTGRTTHFMSERKTNCGKNIPTVHSQQKYACVFEKRGEFN